LKVSFGKALEVSSWAQQGTIGAVSPKAIMRYDLEKMLGWALPSGSNMNYGYTGDIGDRADFRGFYQLVQVAPNHHSCQISF